MINFLFLLATAAASDVYEVCVHKFEEWSEDKQDWVPKTTQTYYTTETLQFIVHENTFEMNRKTRQISGRETIDDLSCFREHKNSFVCYDPIKKEFLWEFWHRNGRVTRDVLRVCMKNGEPA